MISSSVRVMSEDFLFYPPLSGFYVFWQCPAIRIRTFCEMANANPSRLRHQNRHRIDELFVFHPLPWLVHTSHGSAAGTARLCLFPGRPYTPMPQSKVSRFWIVVVLEKLDVRNSITFPGTKWGNR